MTNISILPAERFATDGKSVAEVEFTLPRLCDGVTLRVLGSIKSDGGATDRYLDNMRRENSALYQRMVAASIQSPDPGASLALMTVYYSIYSESAKVNGGSMPVIGLEYIYDYFRQEMEFIGIFHELEESVEEAICHRNSNIREFEIAQDPELRTFWEETRDWEKDPVVYFLSNILHGRQAMATLLQ